MTDAHKQGVSASPSVDQLEMFDDGDEEFWNWNLQENS